MSYHISSQTYLGLSWLALRNSENSLNQQTTRRIRLVFVVCNRTVVHMLGDDATANNDTEIKEKEMSNLFSFERQAFFLC